MKVKWFQEYFICNYKKFFRIIFKFLSKNFFCYCYKVLEICFFMSFLVVGGIQKQCLLINLMKKIILW